MSGNMRKLNKSAPMIAIAANEGELLRVENDWSHKCILSDHMSGTRFIPDPDVNNMYLQNTLQRTMTTAATASNNSNSYNNSSNNNNSNSNSNVISVNVSNAEANTTIAPISINDEISHVINEGAKGKITIKPLMKSKPYLRLAKGLGDTDTTVADSDLMTFTQPPLGQPSALKKIDALHNYGNKAATMNQKIEPKFVKMTEIPLDTSDEKLKTLRFESIGKVQKLRRYKYGISPTHKNLIFDQYIVNKQIEQMENTAGTTHSAFQDIRDNTNAAINDGDFKVVDVNTSSEDIFNEEKDDTFYVMGPMSDSRGQSRQSTEGASNPASPSSRRSARSDSPSSSYGRSPKSPKPIGLDSSSNFDNIDIDIPLPQGSPPSGIQVRSFFSAGMGGRQDPSSPNSNGHKPGSATKALLGVLPSKELTIQADNLHVVSFQLLENTPKSSQQANAGSKKGQQMYDATQFRRPIPIKKDEELTTKIKEQEEKMKAEEDALSRTSDSKRSTYSSRKIIGNKFGDMHDPAEHSKILRPQKHSDVDSQFSSVDGNNDGDVQSGLSRDGVYNNSARNKGTTKLKCTHCSSPGTLWCGECALAFCYVCWGQVAHHSQLDINDFLTSKNPNMNANNSNSNNNLMENQSYSSFNNNRGKVDLSALPFKLPKKPYFKHRDYHLNPVLLDGTGKISELKRDYLQPMRKPDRHELKDDGLEYVEEMDSSIVDDELFDNARPMPPDHGDLSELGFSSVDRRSSLGSGQIKKRQPLFLKSASASLLPGKNLVPSSTTKYIGSSNLTEELDKLIGFSHSEKAQALQDKQIEFKKSSRVGLPGEDRLLEIERRRRRKYKKIEKPKTLSRGAIISVGPHGAVSCMPPRVIGKDAEFIKMNESNLINLFPPGKEKDRQREIMKGKLVFTVDVPKEPVVPYVPLKDRVKSNEATEESAVSKEFPAEEKITNVENQPTSGSSRPTSRPIAAAHANAAPTPSLPREIATTRAFMEELTDTMLDAPQGSRPGTATSNGNGNSNGKANLTVQTTNLQYRAIDG